MGRNGVLMVEISTGEESSENSTGDDPTLW